MYNNKDEETFKGHPLSVEDYFMTEMLKANRLQTDDKLNKVINCLLENLYNLEMDGKDIMPKTTQPPKHTNADYPGEKPKVVIDNGTGKILTYKHVIKKHSP